MSLVVSCFQNEIHSKRLYRRQDVTKKDFHHNMFVYTKVKSLQGH